MVAIESKIIEPPSKKAPWLVFLHEGLGSSTQWRDIPDRLCQALGYGGLVFSRRGYGASSPPQSGMDWGVGYLHEQALVDLPAILAACLPDPMPDYHLIGHSDGASIALIHAAHHQVCQSAVLIAPHVMVESVTLEGIRQAKVAYEDSDHPLRSQLARYHQHPDVAFWGWNRAWLSSDFQHWDIRPLLGTIQCPLLLIQGDRDAYGTMAQLTAIAQGATLASVQIQGLSDCGHHVPREKPDRLIEMVVHWMKDQGRA